MSHVNIGPNTGLLHRINTLDNQRKRIIRLCHTMELIQPLTKLRWIRFRDFRLTATSLGQEFTSLGEPAALKKQSIKDKLIYGLFKGAFCTFLIRIERSS